MDAELTVVISARGSEAGVTRLLSSLSRQDYAAVRETRILVAEVGPDGLGGISGVRNGTGTKTAEAVARFRDRLAVETIASGSGVDSVLGSSAEGRNAGARMAGTPYVLFLDADVEIPDRTLVRRAMEAMKTRDLHLATTGIGCRHGGFLDDVVYLANNLMQKISGVVLPLATGRFMLFDLKVFRQLGGFNERATLAEGYLLSKQVGRERFGVVPGKVLTTNRRLRSIGHWRMVWMFVRTMLHGWEEEHFLRNGFLRDPFLREHFVGEQLMGEDGRWGEV